MKRLHFIIFRGTVDVMSKSLQTEIPVNKSAGRPKAKNNQVKAGQERIDRMKADAGNKLKEDNLQDRKSVV